ncbi:MAG: hypothetical protein HLUCCA11_07065 [Phormidesmis priestleyi Ana]|uniref:Uncharacterized protein n=1 Tax=Phormidesmis priestleyi Ana TaxID=1666911 RepID=A0A0P8DHW6_9CYAN|nr:MAG: hypothetical protein HLUCCA11_07065 [Phormidesmis priestleyi Ana]
MALITSCLRKYTDIPQMNLDFYNLFLIQAAEGLYKDLFVCCESLDLLFCKGFSYVAVFQPSDQRDIVHRERISSQRVQFTRGSVRGVFMKLGCLPDRVSFGHIALV